MKNKAPKFVKPFFNFYYFAKEKISRSIRLELMVSFVICIIAAFIVGSWYNGYYREKNSSTEIDYSSGIKNISDEYYFVKDKIESGQLSIKNENAINDVITSAYSYNADNSTVKLFLTDLDGKVLFETKNAKEKNINIYEYVKKAAEFKKEREGSTITYSDSGIFSNTGIFNQRITFDKVVDYVDLDGIDFTDKKVFLVIIGSPKENTIYIKPQGSLFSILQGVVAFIALFYFLTSKKMRYIEKISEGLFQISKNKLDYRIEIEGKDELAKLSNNINFMTKELNIRSEREKNAEKTKSDLITNVSHDLRTPLTSIKGYIALSKDKKYRNEEELMEYLNIAYNKSEKLEVLINDLFEYTKLSNKGIALQREIISVKGLLEQLIEEIYVICEENNVVIIREMPSDEVYANVDGDKMVRVFENLIINAIRYGTKPGKIKVKVTSMDSEVCITVENKCENLSKEDLEKIFDRFYRTDKSRTEDSGGSGLGLAISKSIVELHEGKIWAEMKGDNIIFFVRLKQ